VPPFDAKTLPKGREFDCDAEQPCGALGGGDCVVSADGIARCGAEPFAHPLFVLISIGGVTIGIMLLYLVMRFCRRGKKNMRSFGYEFRLVFSVALTLFDFTTDCFFLDFLVESAKVDASLQPFVYACIASIAVPIVVNTLLLIRELRTKAMVPYWGRWCECSCDVQLCSLHSTHSLKSHDQYATVHTAVFFYEHQAIGALVFLIATTNCSLFNVISSRLLGLGAFSAPVSAMTESRLSARGMVSNLLEDLPQLVIQIIIVSKQDELNIFVLTSIVASGITLAFGVTKRLLVNEMTNAAMKQRASESSDQSHVGGRESKMEMSTTINMMLHEASQPPSEASDSGTSDDSIVGDSDATSDVLP
jgi:hypothetical protein